MATTFLVPDGRVAMAATLYTGNGSTQSISNAVNGVSFQPDFVWVKGRNEAFYHRLTSSLQSPPNYMSSNATDAENTTNGTISAITSTGFSVNINGGTGGTNSTGINYVGWQWKAGGTAVSNTAGTITSSVSANTTAGFSVVTYTGTGANATVGHGLGVVPGMIIVKNRTSGVPSWRVYHSALPYTSYLYLDTTNAAFTGGGVWTQTPTTTLFGINGADAGVGTANNYVAYCWAPVAGYSAFGSYTGNGAGPNGPFVYLGFRPRWLMIKCSSNGTTYTSWYMVDTAREPANISSGTVPGLWANLSAAEGYRGNGVTNPDTINYVDMLSNGFKVISTNSDELNNSGWTYIYAAFAENPLKYSNAR